MKMQNIKLDFAIFFIFLRRKMHLPLEEDAIFLRRKMNLPR